MKFIAFYITFIIVKFIFGNYCPKETPIYKNGQCKLTYCTKQQFQNGDCIIKNDIIKTQWLTNIIDIGTENSKFINFANYSNGTLILEASNNPGSSDRFFFGLNSDGSYLFEENGSHQIILTAQYQTGNDLNKRFYAENFCVTINEREGKKEYIVSIANKEQYLELYDFDTRSIIQRKSADIIGNTILGLRHSSANFFNNSLNSIIFLTWVDIPNDDINNNFQTKILNFKTKNLDFEELACKDYANVDVNFSKTTSCFVSKSNFIWTIGFIQEKNPDSLLNYYIFVFSPYNLTEPMSSEIFQAFPFWDLTFFKMVHLRDDIGVLFYYSYPYDGLLLAFPSFLIREIKNNELNNYLKPNGENRIIIDFHNRSFDYDFQINDLIRISDYKVSLATTNFNIKEILYIVILEIYTPQNYFLKLYEINLYSFYNIKFYHDIREHLFEKNIAFGFNYCHNEICHEDDNSIHFSSFLIFGYPNSTDDSLNINQYLEQNEGKKIDDIEINLSKNVYIENNIFGYIYSSIDITNLIGCDDLILKSSLDNGKEIKKGSEISENENIKIAFKNKMKAFNCKIYFRYIVTEQDFSQDQNYYVDIIKSNANLNIENTHNSNKGKYPGKISFYNILFDYTEPTTIIEPEYQSTIITHKATEKQTTIIAETESEKITEKIKKTTINTYHTEEMITEKVTEKQTEKITEKIVEKTELEDKIITDKKIETQKIEDKKTDEKKEINVCSDKEVLANRCGNGIVEIVRIKEIFHEFSNNIISFDYQGGDMKIIETENVIFQIIILNAQDISQNPNVSVVNIGECEKILKSIYNISESDSLIMVKSDSKNGEASAKNIIFDLYHPITKEKLNMSYCDNVEIKIDIPTKLENNTIDLYDSLVESGYNLFDSSDSFYNDACSTYTSSNGTDMTLSDRQNIIYAQAGNISLCQSGCNFKLYNKTYKTVQCDCSIKSTSVESNSGDIDEKELKNSFISTILNSNFIILKCIKTAFNFKSIFTNKGRIAMTIIIFFFIVIIVIFFINDKNNINKYFKTILKDKVTEEENNTSKNDKESNISDNKQKSEKLNLALNKPEDNNIIKIENKKKLFPPKRNRLNRSTNKLKVNIIQRKRPAFNFFNSIIKSSKEELNKIDMISEKKMQERIKLKEQNKIKSEIKTIKETDESELYKNMNDEELNSLEYEKALIYDKRTFFQYYWSLLKKDHKILFTFISNNDYNLISLKMTLLVLSLSLEITINGFFFTDDTMHQIHENNGEFDLIYQIPQILYSSILSTIINSLLQKLALSEDSFLSIKHIKDYNKAIKQCEKIKRCLTIKFIIFINISFILMIFCWYYISSFCGVYINTQSILFKDTLISLLLSMVYPFGLCLLPGLCRIPALQAENKDKRCMYKFSGLMELL